MKRVLGVGVVSVALVLGAGVHAEEAGPVAFVFANAEGKRLLTFDEGKDLLDSPQGLVTGICSNGAVVRTRYVGYQQAKGEQNGRRTHYTFDRAAGHLFEIVSEGRLPKEASCVLGNAKRWPAVSTSALKSRGSWENKEYVQPEPCRPVLVKAAERAVKARASGCGPLLPEKGEDRAATLVFLEGVKVPVAVLAFANRDGVFILEDQAGSLLNETTCWRVDDGCALDRERYELVAVHSGKSTSLFILDNGPEGQGASLAELSGGKIVPRFRTSRYWAPD